MTRSFGQFRRDLQREWTDEQWSTYVTACASFKEDLSSNTNGCADCHEPCCQSDDTDEPYIRSTN